AEEPTAPATIAQATNSPAIAGPFLTIPIIARDSLVRPSRSGRRHVDDDRRLVAMRCDAAQDSHVRRPPATRDGPDRYVLPPKTARAATIAGAPPGSRPPNLRHA